MTPREFYEWALAHGCENNDFTIKVRIAGDYEEFELEEFSMDVYEHETIMWLE